MLKKIALVLTLFIIAACSREQQAQAPITTKSIPFTQATASAAAMPEAAGHTTHYLVFFLDPNGGPCRMQNSILTSMAEELKGRVSIRYVQTTEAADKNLFYKYGIRALPTLLLADATGNEIRRMTPGVKSAADVRSLINSLPSS